MPSLHFYETVDIFLNIIYLYIIPEIPFYLEIIKYLKTTYWLKKGVYPMIPISNPLPQLQWAGRENL